MNQNAWLARASVRPTTFIAAVVLACIASVSSAQTVSVWSGVYTAAQGKRGEELHAAVCVMCHGRQLNGAGQPEMPPSPAIARVPFFRKWAGQTAAALFVYVRHTMPTDSPGTLTDQQAIDAIAHMLAVSGIPAGEKELPPDPEALARIMIEAPPK
jgi:cytochrome c